MYSLLPALVAIYFSLVGYYLWRNAYELQASHRAFLVLCITTFFWQATWAVLFQSTDALVSNALVRFGYLMILFLPTSLYQLLVELSDSPKDRHFVSASYLLSMLLGVLLLTTDLFITGYYEYFWGHYPKAGSLHWIHVAQTTMVVMRGLFLTITTARVADEPQKSILRCCTISGFIYFLAAIDYACNYGLEFYPPGIYFIAVSLTIIGYAMVKKDLFDIRIVISRLSAHIMVGCLIGLTIFVINSFQHPSVIFTILLNTLVALAWAKYGERLRQALQTATEKKWITDWYSATDIITRICDRLYRANDRQEMLMEVANVLKDTMGIKDIYVFIYQDNNLKAIGHQNTLEAISLIELLAQHENNAHRAKDLIHHNNAGLCDRGVILVLRSSQGLEGIIWLSVRLSENPYSSADIELLTTVSQQTSVFFEAKNHEIKNKGVKSLAASIAHEMRSPLSQISNVIWLANNQASQQYKPTENYLHHINQVIQNSCQVIDMTMDAINEKPVNKDDFIVLSARAFVTDALQCYAYNDLTQADKIAYQALGADFELFADPITLKHVLYNLIDNALYYVKNMADARIELSVLADKRQIVVRDTGPGIAAESIPKIFDSFYTDGKLGGTGLGLPYCKRTMEALDGDIRCESELGQYTAFILSFPQIPQVAVN